MYKNLQEVGDDFLALWPDMEYPWIYDREKFLIPPVEMMQRAIVSTNVSKMQVIGEFSDCDDFALHFLSEFRMKQYKAFLENRLADIHQFPAAVGIAFGDKFRGIETPHILNIADCEEGVYLIDAYPGVQRIWKADPKNDNVIKLSYM